MDGGSGSTGNRGRNTGENRGNHRKSLFFHIPRWMCDVKYYPLAAGAHTDPDWNFYFTCGLTSWRSVVEMQYFTLTFS